MVAARGRSTDRGWLQQGLIRSNMLGKTLLPGDEELGKKDDDHRFVPARRSAWSGWNHTFRWRRRRNLLLLIALLVVWSLHRSMGGVWAPSEVGGSTSPPGRPHNPSTTYDKPTYDNDEPTGAPPGIAKPHRGETASHTYNGQVRFFRLARTLRPAASRSRGYEKENRNILFAVSSLQSAATLLPMICEMSKWSRNHVHAAFMGRADIGLEDLLEINGIEKEKCSAVWHDARPDFMEYSSDIRSENAVMGAMSHIYSFLHPQAIIMDDSLSEDAFFVRGIRVKSTSLDLPLIEVPKDRVADFTWVTRLDAGSLRNWHTPTVDILVQVTPGSSSVLRLLKSIRDADYSGLTPPRIILELPANLDISVKQHIEKFTWPPHDDAETPAALGGLILRRRITNLHTTQEDSAIRFLELSYPATHDSHVLLLSPQAQLSPQYFHFVKYSLLEYKYSTFGQDDNTALMGISLDLPSTLLDGKNALAPPELGDMHTERYTKLYPNVKSVPFLWQAPNTHAALFFGEKWVEWHGFLGNRVRKHQSNAKAKPRKKEVSETMPSWAEYMLEFMRARGYAILYPAATPQALVTVHNELYHAPEEFTPPQKDDDLPTPSDLPEPFLKGDIPPPPPSHIEPPTLTPSTPLHEALPFTGDLPEIPHLPYLQYTGKLTAHKTIVKTAKEYADVFRKEIGGCEVKDGKRRKVVKGETADLFCFGEEDEEEWVSEGDADGDDGDGVDKLKEELDKLLEEEDAENGLLGSSSSSSVSVGMASTVSKTSMSTSTSTSTSTSMSTTSSIGASKATERVATDEF
ncbi:hypothetical protein T440DRAFT_472614 [Plenodomus tracheiphilus IPT5]|uniref:Uncharacterized protein n=1 Tax=Plenodomus tracheiphilus IPT5 TaxID=1408161 RepID=A0A6A7AQX9_9PLEO|nr:hypothetical protein T440DRAFT_472614 [Plenodomus tracheiphilus IPT5]